MASGLISISGDGSSTYLVYTDTLNLSEASQIVGSIVYSSGAYASVALLSAVANASNQIIFTFSTPIPFPTPAVPAVDVLIVGWKVISVNNVFLNVYSLEFGTPFATTAIVEAAPFGVGSTFTNVDELGTLVVPIVNSAKQPTGAVDYATFKLNSWGASAYSSTPYNVLGTAITAITDSGNTTAVAINPPTGVPSTATSAEERFYAFGTTSLQVGLGLGDTLRQPLPPGSVVRFSIAQRSGSVSTQSQRMFYDNPMIFVPAAPDIFERTLRLYNDDEELFSNIDTGRVFTIIDDIQLAPNSGDILLTYRLSDSNYEQDATKVLPRLVSQLIGGARITFTPINAPADTPSVVFYDWGFNFTAITSTDLWAAVGLPGLRTISIPRARVFKENTQWVASVEVTSAPRRACIKVPDATTPLFDEQEALARAQWRSISSKPFTYPAIPPFVPAPFSSSLTIIHTPLTIQAGTSFLFMAINAPDLELLPTRTYRFIIYDGSGNQYGAPIYAARNLSAPAEVNASLIWLTPPGYTNFTIVAAFGTQGNFQAWETTAPVPIPAL